MNPPREPGKLGQGYNVGARKTGYFITVFSCQPYRAVFFASVVFGCLIMASVAPGTQSWVYTLRKAELLAWLEGEEVPLGDANTVADLRRLAIRHIRSINDPVDELPSASVPSPTPDVRVNSKLFFHALQTVEPMTSSDSAHILLFLCAVYRLHKLALVPAVTLLQALVLKVQSPLDTILQDVLSQGADVTHFISTAISSTCSARTLDSLKYQFLFRTQFPMESAVQFLEQTSVVAAVLGIHLSEEERINSCLQYLTPEYRALLPVFARPVDLSSLRNLVQELDNYRRQQVVPSPVPSAPLLSGVSSSMSAPLARHDDRACNRTSPSVTSRPTLGPIQQPARSARCANCGVRGHLTDACRRPAVPVRLRPCFRCGRGGHVARTCPGN